MQLNLNTLHRIGPASLLTTDFLTNPLSQQIYLIGPKQTFSDTRNDITGRHIYDVREDLQQLLDEAEINRDANDNHSWANAYDATTLLLQAIHNATRLVEDGLLEINRQAIFDNLRNTRNVKGLTGTLSCDNFGDCAAPTIVIYHHINPTPTDSSLINNPREYLEEISTRN